MRKHHTLIVLLVTVALCTRAEAQEPVPRPTTDVVNPMSRFARMIPGEWKMTVQAGTSLCDAWHWGPGEHSMRVMTDGFGADGNPWRALSVYYWHPALKQVRMLALSPYARGVSQGTISLEGDRAEMVYDIYQTPGRRKLIQRWTFDGSDKYNAALLDATDPGPPVSMAAWDYFRIKTRPATQPVSIEARPKIAERLKPLEPLLQTWGSDGNALRTQSSVELIPLADAIYARIVAPMKDGRATHLLDAYLYHHTETGKLRCLALSHTGGVYEGDVNVLQDGALQIELKGYERDDVVDRIVRLDFEKDQTLRQRIWSIHAGERSLVLDVQHKTLER